MSDVMRNLENIPSVPGSETEDDDGDGGRPRQMMDATEGRRDGLLKKILIKKKKCQYMYGNKIVILLPYKPAFCAVESKLNKAR